MKTGTVLLLGLAGAVAFVLWRRRASMAAARTTSTTQPAAPAGIVAPVEPTVMWT